MEKHEQAFLLAKLRKIASDVEQTPVYCGVKVRALLKIEALMDAVTSGELKNPPPPERSKEQIEMDKMLFRGAYEISGKKGWEAAYKKAVAKRNENAENE